MTTNWPVPYRQHWAMWYSSLICTCTIIQNWLVQFRHHCVLFTEHISSLIVTIFVVRVVEMVQHMTLVPIHELTKRKLFTYFINRDHFAHIFMIFFSTKYIGSKCLAASLIRHEDVTKQFTSCKTCLKFHFSWLVAGIPVSSGIYPNGTRDAATVNRIGY